MMYVMDCFFLQHFQVGTKNMKNSDWMGGKLDAKWDGPYTVEAKLSMGRYQLISKNGTILKKICLLKEYLEESKHGIQSTRKCDMLYVLYIYSTYVYMYYAYVFCFFRSKQS